MEDVRICTFGYPADWAAPKDSSLTILDFAKHLNFEILVQDLTDASILYVVHSMGGLVVKKVRIPANTNLYRAHIKTMSRHICSPCKTPCTAEWLAQSDVARCCSSVRLTAARNRLRLCTSSCPSLSESKPFIQELVGNSSTLADINEDFRHHAKDLKLWSFRETDKTNTAPGVSSVRALPGLKVVDSH